MKKYYAFIILYIFVPLVYGQQPEGLEKEYRGMNQNMAIEQCTLDSLNRAMENIAKDIDREKKNSTPDQNKLVQWMSHAVTVSDQIKTRQKQISDLQKVAEEMRQRIEAYYTRTIDSLRRIEESGQYKGDKSALHDQILIWTEKRILISPLVKMLTFDPMKVQEIDLANAKDPLEQAIMGDYLRKALEEIDILLSRLSATKKEYEEIVSLRRRTIEFVNESNDQGRISAVSRMQTYASSVGADPGSGVTPLDYTSSQARTVVGLIQQITSGIRLTPSQLSSAVSKSTVTQEEYIDLLKQAEKQLKSYRDRVQKKLK